ncbi:MAG: phosphatidylserine decarboxylase family protein [Dehalococcoidales bacterium]|nr:MAG: phosphatidylserine decarboxylase family protein [Dehalococcoidales bacterium]
MRWEIAATSLAFALVFLPLLAWKWRVQVKTAIAGGVIIGALTGLIVSQIGFATGLNTAVLIVLELPLILLITAAVLLARFYRDPERSPTETGNVILSPADGTVVYVNKVEKGSALVSTKGEKRFRLDEITDTNLLPDTAYLIGIDMNILNVHVNRAPIAGKTLLRKRIAGQFMSLRRQESETLNERVTTIIGNGSFSVGVVQIASRLVRKIVSYVKEGDDLAIGQRIGAIVFGSQVDIAIPELENLSISVKIGDELKAGISVVARFG